MSDQNNNQPPSNPPVKPWERQPGESDVAFEAWVTYRDLGTKRNVSAAAAKLGKTESTLRKWANKYSWVNRCSEWANYTQSVRTEGIAVEMFRSGIDWERARQQLMDYEMAVSFALFRKSLAMIVAADDETRERVGRLASDERALYLKNAAGVAKEASQMGWGTVNAGLGDVEHESGSNAGRDDGSQPDGQSAG